MVGWSPERPLESCRLLEPGAGEGAFAVPAARRLLRSWKLRGNNGLCSLSHAITAVEIDPELCRLLRARLAAVVIEEGIGATSAERLAQLWVRCANFLELPLAYRVTHIVGNPPFARNVHARADLFVAFTERSLDLLNRAGRLALVSPFGWWTNRVARPLCGRMVDTDRIRALVDLSRLEPFERNVGIHGVITVVEKDGAAESVIKARPNSLEELRSIAYQVKLGGVRVTAAAFRVRETGGPLLVTGGSLDIALQAAKKFPDLQSVGCEVRVGIATASNNVFVGSADYLNVERNVLRPAVEISDFRGNRISWRGHYIIDPFTEDGRLLPRATHPRLHRRLAAHRPELEARFAVKRGMDWWRPLERPNVGLLRTPKLLIPEVGSRIRVAIDTRGSWLPLHSVHSVTSSEWPLRALQSAFAFGLLPFWALLLDTRRGRSEYRRLNASALRLVRLPEWGAVPEHDREILIRGSSQEVGQIVARWYKLRDSLLKEIAELVW